LGWLPAPPVTREHEVVGVLSERDILAWRGEGRGLDGPNDRVAAAMTAPPIVTVPDEELGEAAARMIASRIDCLPVVMAERLVGMITSTDLLGRLVAQTFEPASRDDAPAADVMSPRVFTAFPSDALLEAADVMVANHVRHLPVVDEAGHLVGILSERDLRAALGRPAEAVAHWPLMAGRAGKVGDVMTSPVISIHAEQPLSRVITTMVDCGVGALPVVDRENRPIGIVSYLDVLRRARRERR
jgi:CBS domain-containing protein